jgi:hypothetical protein
MSYIKFVKETLKRQESIKIISLISKEANRELENAILDVYKEKVMIYLKNNRKFIYTRQKKDKIPCLNVVIEESGELEFRIKFFKRNEFLNRLKQDQLINFVLDEVKKSKMNLCFVQLGEEHHFFIYNN